MLDRSPSIYNRAYTVFTFSVGATQARCCLSVKKGNTTHDNYQRPHSICENGIALIEPPSPSSFLANHLSVKPAIRTSACEVWVLSKFVAAELKLLKSPVFRAARLTGCESQGQVTLRPHSLRRDNACYGMQCDPTERHRGSLYGVFRLSASQVHRPLPPLSFFGG